MSKEVLDTEKTEEIKAKTLNVLSLERMRYLQETGLNIVTASAWYWIVRNGIYDHASNQYIFPEEPDYISLKLQPYVFMDDVAIRKVECIPALTLDDIIDLLPKKIKCEPLVPDFYLYINYQDMRISYAYTDKRGYTWLNPSATIEDGKLIDAAYKMLCWCIDRGFIETNKKQS